MELKDITTFEACILQARAYRVLRDFVAHQLHGYDLTVMEWVLLGVICEAGPGGTSPSALSERLDVSLPMVTRMAASVQAQGYITKTENTVDKRQHIIAATDKGFKHSEIIERQIRLAMREWLKDIEPAELLGYVRSMSRIANM